MLNIITPVYLFQTYVAVKDRNILFALFCLIQCKI